MSIDKLIQAIEDLREASYTSTGTIYTSDVIDLINTHMEGNVIVPVEPTSEMLEAGHNSMYCCDLEYFTWMHANIVYKAMISTIGAKDDEVR